jgi:HKD family nuclease
MIHLGPFTTTSVHPIADAARNIAPDRIRVASAFATEAGFELLRAKLVGRTAFDAANIQALVGIQGGITQPEALKRLMKAARTEVRVPFGAAALATRSLRAPIFFHPKIYAFENTTSKAMAIISGSANLTYNGLRGGVENLFTWTGSASDAVALEFDAWWNSTWNAADPVDPAFLAAYAAARPTLPTPRSVRQSWPRGPATRTLWQAQTLWVELVRKPEGGAFNQVELLLSAHDFFYPKNQNPSKAIPKRLTFTDASGAVYANRDRSIRFNGPPLRAKGNSMWRIYMPTEKEGLTGYQDGDVLVRFDRTTTPDHYLISIADINSLEAASWLDSSSGIATKQGVRPRRMGWS